MQLRPRGVPSSKRTPNQICWGQVEGGGFIAGVAFVDVGGGVREGDGGAGDGERGGGGVMENG